VDYVFFQPSERNLQFFPRLGTPSRNSSTPRKKSVEFFQSPEREAENLPTFG
jgi:hypothetical protein